MSDKNFTITISEDKMFAYLKANSKDQKLDAREVLDQMEKDGISFGIRKSIFTSFKTLNDALNVTPILEIARGVGPKKGSPAELIFSFDKDRVPGKPFIDSNGRAHYRKLNYVENIDVGSLLVEKKMARKGFDGRNVLNELLSAEYGEDLLVEHSDNVIPKKISEKNCVRYYSLVPGMPTYNDEKLNVETSINIDRDIDFSVGNINFNGSLLVAGNVKRGFLVECIGNIEIGGNVDFSSVIAGQNLKILNGVVTGKKKSVIAGNNASIKFSENSNVTIGNDLFVDNWILHSFVDCKGKVVLSEEKGMIVGGKIKSGISVEANEIGSEANVETEIVINYNDEYYKNNDLIDYYNALVRKIYLFKDEIKKSYEMIEKVKNSENMDFTQKATLIEKISEKIYDKRELLVKEEEEEVSFKQFLIENNYVLSPQVLVRHKIYPGVKLFFNDTVFIIRKEYERVKFYLDDSIIKMEGIL